jgi:hypothetical protein
VTPAAASLTAAASTAIASNLSLSTTTTTSTAATATVASSNSANAAASSLTSVASTIAEFSNIEEAVLNEDAFRILNGQTIKIKNTEDNARKSLQQARDLILKAVKSVGNIEKQWFALYSALCHPELHEQQAKTAGFHLEESNEARTALHLVNPLWGMLVLANATAARQGRSKDDQQSFMEAVGSAVVTTPGDIGAPSDIQSLWNE